ncbi:serine hydrolase domain-containing protein [Nocardia jejuensis]|uniref:serine hydrolase domain-containing protein n=1 Tax=Nocardia jejuensis TaxID=328049 RepID=UPI00082AF5E5|nr:serine hydrolase domain-containing protein [Nocardia jejuensis]
MSDITRSENTLSTFIEAAATDFGIPGVAVGIFVNGREIFASHGVTSIENPLPVDENTLFAIGSISKPTTATALMRLVAEGAIDIEAPVRRYVPELNLPEERAAAEITVKQLLNHTAGLDWNLINNTGEGDDALAEFVASLAEIPLIGEPGGRSSYSQAGFNLLGRVIENVTGLGFEEAVATLVLEPIGLPSTFYFRDDIMTRRFAAGHEREETGELSVSRIWKGTRANNPGGGLASTVTDQLRFARYHLGDGRTANGVPLLPAETLLSMREPTVELRASLLGDAHGLCWFLRDIDGVRTFGHGGSGFGQFGEMLVVPEHDCAIVVLSNASPDSILCNQVIVRWVLENYLGVLDKDPQPLPYNDSQVREILGDYANEAMTMTVTTDGATLHLECLIKPEIREAAGAEMPQDHPPFEFGLLPGDEYIITKGSFQGQRGFFSRDESGTITGADLGGRLFPRVS